MKKILVLGIKGMAGHVIYTYLTSTLQYEVFGLARNIEASEKVFSVDACDLDELENILSQTDYDFVINCMGLLNQNAESNISKAIWINSYFPHYLEDFFRGSKCVVIHLSTDCVFSGSKGNYSETDIRDGQGIYSITKSMGELDNCKDLTIRTSIIGPELVIDGLGLFGWFVKQRGTITGYKNVIWSGVTTLELAKFVDFLISNPVKGIIHLTNGIPISKFDLLCLFNKYWKQNRVVIVSSEEKVVNKSLLRSSKFEYVVPDYEVMMLDLLKWINKYPSIYKHYK